MFIKVDLYTFRQQFEAMNRGATFSYQGQALLFEYLEELEHCEEQTELDVIALCCDFAEDESRGVAHAYQIDTQGMDDNAVVEAVREYLEDQGALVGQTDRGSFVYRQH